MKRLSILAVTAGCLMSFQAMAATIAEMVEVSNPYVRMVPPNAPATAAFMELKNTSGKDHALVSAKAYINKTTELHNHIHDNGVMRMRQVQKIDLPAGQSTALKPGGFHIMLIGLDAPVEKDQKIKIDLTFDDGSTKTIEAKGRPLMPMKGMKMGMMGGKQLTNGRNTNPMQLVMHANPAFPNLTGIAIKNAQELGLSDEQVRNLKAWTNKHGDEMKRMFQAVNVAEKALIQDSLAGQSKAELMAKFQKTLDMRKKIAETKIDCRDNMKKVLTAEQFDKLASIYPMM